jgi:hypothetical protein
MDYHSDRFADHSLVVCEEGGGLLALVPAHAAGEAYVSHGGLTFGGIVTGREMKTPVLLHLFEAVAEYLVAHGFRRWVYKTVPHIYHRWPAEEDRYALFLGGAALTRRDMLVVVQRGERLEFQQRRRRSIQKALKKGLTAGLEASLEEFWPVVEANLRERHTASPVHTLSEIRLLQSRFPDHIQLFGCRRNGELLGGVLIYESEQVAHVQYIASTAEGRELGALDLLFQHLLSGVYANKLWFDFGISNEDSGRRLNRGLIEQKEGFGARAVAHDQYTVDLASWEPGRLMRAMQ